MTGSSRGIGACIAQELANNGCKVEFEKMLVDAGTK